MTYDTIRWQQDGAVGTVTLDRPDQLNGIVNAMMRELHGLLREVAASDDIAVVVLTGAGRAFCPGADLKHYSSGAPQEALRPEYFEIPVLLHEMPQVTVAAVNGACAGAGLGWACACDLRYAARSARFNTAFLDVAVAGDMGLPWTLPRIVGSGLARELSLLPRKLDAEEAARIGLVNGVFDDTDLMAEVQSRVQRLAGAAPLALRGLAEHYSLAERVGFADFVSYETERHLRISASDDCSEAFAAFVEKRTPRFGGR